MRPPNRELARAVEWWVRQPQPALPFYCNPGIVGECAVDPALLRTGDEAALFKLFVALSMFQALRDVVVVERQRSLTRSTVRPVFELRSVARASRTHPCPALRSAASVLEACDVSKSGGAVDCGSMPGQRCPVKHATVAFNRMANLGKLPVHAWHHSWRDGGVTRVLKRVIADTPSPSERAERLVEHFAGIHRVGRKLATLFVSALSTPVLAPGLTPWFPAVDGNSLIVVDTNVSRAVDSMRGARATKSYSARERWIRGQANRLELTKLDPPLPARSPRLLAEALYAFCSKSNRTAAADRCAERDSPCDGCAERLCPFGRTDKA